jgi:hypothetical protein
VVFGTVGHVTALEVMAFLIAGETSSDGGSSHIDQIAFLEDVGGNSWLKYKQMRPQGGIRLNAAGGDTGFG